HARAAHGKSFAQLKGPEQDAILTGLEKGEIDLKLPHGLGSHAFFELMLQNTMEGFFADPLYGGNKGMAGWKLVGFPGARYDYRDHIEKHNVPYPKGPVSIYGEA
ncbi:MAG TPA: gluconate 2-dehydrogenase subunit 3 family protein, partial [Rhizomicrobium sp.]